MTRQRKIRHYPTSGWIVRLKQQDIQDLNIDDGDYMDIDDCVIIKKLEKKNE